MAFSEPSFFGIQPSRLVILTLDPPLSVFSVRSTQEKARGKCTKIKAAIEKHSDGPGEILLPEVHSVKSHSAARGGVPELGLRKMYVSKIYTAHMIDALSLPAVATEFFRSKYLLVKH